MSPAARLSAYGAALAVAFVAAFGIAAAVAPADAASAWQDTATEGHTSTSATKASSVRGLSIAQDGFMLSPVTAPGQAGTSGVLSFRVLDASDAPVTEFTTSHDKDLHLIVVRSDGTQFRHVHPELDAATGTWSLPWTWDEGGTFRVFADFVPADDERMNITLSRTVEVSGPSMRAPVLDETRTHEVDGFEATISGDLVAGSTTELTVTIARDGEPVTTLQPYLGAFGHLVVLRQGDLGYLHVHAEGDDPRPGDTAGPSITFATEAPTAGGYLLYLDFRIGGQVHTAQFVLDAAAGHSVSGDQAHDTDSGGH